MAIALRRCLGRRGRDLLASGCPLFHSLSSPQETKPVLLRAQAFLSVIDSTSYYRQESEAEEPDSGLGHRFHWLKQLLGALGTETLVAKVGVEPTRTVKYARF